MTDWLSAWENDQAVWHREEFNPMLEKHLEKITDNKPNAKLFFPLCGKAVDILYLVKMGNQVIGVEYSELAVQQFFKESGLTFTTKPVVEMDGVLYENEENQIKIYCGDFFKFTPSLERDFDGIWDRGALEAIEPDLREKYVPIIKAICKTNAGYLLETADRPPGVGPPFHVATEDIVKLYGLSNKAEQVDYEIAPPGLKDMGCDGFFIYHFKMPV